MIICKTPFRISLFGGGTDFPKYYLKNSLSNILYQNKKFFFSIAIDGSSASGKTTGSKFIS